MPRRVASRGVHPFEEPGLFVPDAVVLDTSFIIAALMPSATHHGSAAGFLAQLRLRRPAAAAMREALRAWEDVLSVVTWVRIDVGEVIEQVPDLMGAYGLASHDRPRRHRGLRGRPRLRDVGRWLRSRARLAARSAP